MTKQIINEKANQPTTMTSSTASVTTTILTTTTSMETKTASTVTTTKGIYNRLPLIISYLLDIDLAL